MQLRKKFTGPNTVKNRFVGGSGSIESELLLDCSLRLAKLFFVTASNNEDQIANSQTSLAVVDLISLGGNEGNRSMNSFMSNGPTVEQFS